MLNIDHILPSFAMLFCVMVSDPADAAVCTSTGSGSWGSASTWSCGRVPQGGDTVIVQASHTVSISNNWIYNGAPLHIQVFGTWLFIGGGSKISLPCGSIVEIMVGGQLVPNSNSGGHSETVRICNITYWHYEDGLQSGYVIWPPTVLPIELLYFQGTARNAGVVLEWATATEINSERFEIHISPDGVSEDLIYTGSAAGTSTSTINYEHLDRGRSPGLWYYRLVQYDLDGTMHPQFTVAIHVKDTEKEVTCMPNPVRDGHLFVLLNAGIRDDIDVPIHTPYGSRIESFHVLYETTDMIALDISTLSPGYYLAAPCVGKTRLGTCTFLVQ